MNKLQKVDVALDRIRGFAPLDGSPLYIATSGGKDSCVMLHLARMAGVPFDLHNNVTPDPPELRRFLKTDPAHAGLQLHYPKYSLWRLISDVKMFPPVANKAWCCEYLKHRDDQGWGRTVMLGVRWAESKKRCKWRQKETKTNKFFVQKQTVLPIIDWTEADVWWFIGREKIAYCELYDEGRKRMGCVGCPKAGCKKMIEEFERWPAYKKIYLAAYERMLINRDRVKKKTEWTNADQVFAWTVAERKRKALTPVPPEAKEK